MISSFSSRLSGLCVSLALLLVALMGAFSPAWAGGSAVISGYSFFGMGDGTTTSRTAPGRIGTLTNVVQVDGGTIHSLLRKSDGTVWAFGHGAFGEIGDGTTNQRLSPVQVLASAGTPFTNVGAISVGAGFSVALKNDGTVWCWGTNGNGNLGDGTTTQRNYPTKITSLSSVTAIDAGNDYGMAVTGGNVWSWGYNYYGQLGDNTTTNRLSPVQVLGVGGTGNLTGVTAVSGSSVHSLAVSGGAVYAWGRNNWGQLGNNTVVNSSVPVQVMGPGGVGFLSGVTAVSAGNSFSLALKSDGSVWSWGYNGVGNLGDNTATQRNTPVQVLGVGGVGFLSNVTAISAGDGFALALRSDGSVVAWGDNTYGNQGDGTTVQHKTPILVPAFQSGVSAISASLNSGSGTYMLAAFSGNAAPVAVTDSIGIQTGQATTYGVTLNDYDYDGDTISLIGATNGSKGTVTVSGSSIIYTPTGSNTGTDTFTYTISDGTATSTGTVNIYITATGPLKSWGYNLYGQLGNGFTTDVLSPQPAGVRATGVDGGQFYSLARKSDGTMASWGYNGNGQLGNITTTTSYTPVQVLASAGVPLSNVTAMTSGTSYSLAVSNGGVYAWGGTWGTKPTSVATLTSGFTAVATADTTWIALKSDGTVWAWGYGAFGGLGRGSTADNYTTPNQVLASAGVNLTNVTAISAGQNSFLALKSDGSVWGWGWNGNGQLGINNVVNQTYPAQVLGVGGVGFLTNVTAIAAGNTHSLALKSDGSVWAWGANTYGQLGDGTVTQRTTPVAIPTLGAGSGVVALSGGQNHSLALKSNHAVLAWGYNAYGQLGMGNTTNLSTPTTIPGLLASFIDAGWNHSLAVPVYPPVANNLSFTTTQNTSKSFTLTATDPDAQTLTWQTPATTTQGGTITGTAPNLTYTPPLGFIGNDSFTFTTTDTDNAVSNTATVSITVEETAAAIVTTCADVVNASDGKTSLREAITFANTQNNNNDTITFNIPTSDAGYSGGIYTIQPTAANGALPVMSDTAGTVINATTQPGYAGTPIVVLDGSLIATAGTAGLRLQGSDGSITGLKIINFTGAGITVTPTGSSLRNTLRGNTFVNNNLAIDIGADGVTAGGPTITTCVQQGSNTIVSGTVTGLPGNTLNIDLYSNTTADPSGFGEGQTFVATTSSVVAANGTATFTFTLSGSYAGKFLSAISTVSQSGQDKATSEFGNAIAPAYISGFTPNLGGPGLSVVISGAGFTGATAVKFGGSAAGSFTINSDTQITAIVGAGASGKLTVTTTKGDAVSTGDFTFASGAGPSGLTCDPEAAQPGQIIQIEGDNLAYANGISFNGITATNFQLDGPRQISVTVPEAATSGKITVSSPSGSGQTTNTFTVLPRIDSFTPTAGAVGTSVTITGVGFNGATKVRFSATATTFIDATNFVPANNTNTQIICAAPAGAIDGPIKVVNAAGFGQSSQSFNVDEPTGPAITSFEPSTGPVGSRVKIYGRGFTGATGVQFGSGNPPAIFNVISATQINATVPNIATGGPYTITVSKTGKSDATTTGLTPSGYTVTRAPYIKTFAPAQGIVDDGVTITGANFTLTSDVQFSASPGFGDGTWVSTGFVANSSTSMTIFVPDGAKTGYIRVINPFGTAVSTVEFVVKPEIYSFTPTSATDSQVTSGVVVTITGNSLRSFVKKVKFGIVGSSVGLSAGTKQTNPATPYTDAQLIALGGFVVDSNTQIRAVVPKGAVTGKIRLSYQAGILSTAPTQNADSSGNFTVLPGKPGAPSSQSSSARRN